MHWRGPQDQDAVLHKETMRRPAILAQRVRPNVPCRIPANRWRGQKLRPYAGYTCRMRLRLATTTSTSGCRCNNGLPSNHSVLIASIPEQSSSNRRVAREHLRAVLEQQACCSRATRSTPRATGRLLASISEQSSSNRHVAREHLGALLEQHGVAREHLEVDIEQLEVDIEQPARTPIFPDSRREG